MSYAQGDYVSAGYFLSRHTGARDCTGIELRRVTLAADHSQREYFPNAWTLSWCHTNRQEQIDKAAAFGIAERELDSVIAWADRDFGSAFGAWSVLFSLEDARAAARSMLGNAADLELWGIGLHRDLLNAYCDASRPPAPKPGYAPTGASGTHRAACIRPAPLAEGGSILGHELLIEGLGCTFNSPESLHLDEQELFRAMRVVPNRHGLIDSVDEAQACGRHLDAHAAEIPYPITGWLPWLIVRYPLLR